MIICDKCGIRIPDLSDPLQEKFSQLTIINGNERIHLCHDCEREFWKLLTNDFILMKKGQKDQS